jgi:hypothetical protein
MVKDKKELLFFQLRKVNYGTKISYRLTFKLTYHTTTKKIIKGQWGIRTPGVKTL